MICTGAASIDYLAGETERGDSAESSHWRKYHANFQFRGDGFDGLQGFGGTARPYVGMHLGLHRFFQLPYRNMAVQFPAFTALDALANEITKRQGRAYDLDVLRQTLTLAFLQKHLPKPAAETTTACVIGDGFGSASALLLASGSVSRVILVNLTKTLLVDLWHLRLWLGAEAFEASIDLVTDEIGLSNALAKSASNEEGRARLIAIQATHHKLLRHCPIDMAINIASMQEMDPHSIAQYFSELREVAVRRELLFYCCNRVEKKLPDGTITRFAAYPWQHDDRILVDELCPWHQRYYSFIPPFYHRYDGPIRHRLLALAGAPLR